MSVVSTSDVSDIFADSNSGEDIDLEAGTDDIDLEAGGDDLISEGESGGGQSEGSLKVEGDNENPTGSDDASSQDGKSNDDPIAGSSDDSSKDFEDCNLTIVKEGDKKVQVGDIVTWKITVKNSLNLAENVVVQEALPKNFELVSVKASKGTYNEEMGYWEIGSVNKSESATLTIKAKAKKEGNFTNKAELFTDSNNLNKNTTVEADVEVGPKDKSGPVKKQSQKKDKKVKEKAKNNMTKANNTNDTNKKVDLKNSGNPIMVILISIFVALGLGVLKKQ